MSKLATWLQWVDRLQPDPQDAANWIIEQFSPIDLETYSTVHNKIEQEYDLSSLDVKNLFRVKSAIPISESDNFTQTLAKSGHEGFLTDATALMDRYEAPMAFTFWSWVMFLGAVLSGKLWIEDWDIHPATQILIVGPSQRSRKSSLTRRIKKLATSWADLHELMNQGSPQALLDDLASVKTEHGPIGFIYVSELKTMLEKTENVNFSATLNSIFDRDKTIRYTVRGGRKEIPPGLVSALMCCNEPWLRETFQPSDVEAGFLARFLTIYQGRSDKMVSWPEPINKTLEAELHDRYAAYATRTYGPLVVTPEAKELYDELYSKTWAYEPPVKAMYPFYGRWSEHILRLSLILAASAEAESPVVDRNIMEQTAHIIRWVERSMTGLYQYLGATEFGDWRHRVMDFVQRHPNYTKGVLEREILRQFAQRAKRGARQVQEVLYDLTITGNLIKHEESQDTYYLAARSL